MLCINSRVSCYPMVLKFVAIFCCERINRGSGNKTSRKKYKINYDSLYNTLLYLSQYPIPLTKYRITTNKHVLLSLLSNQFIQLVTDKNLLLNSKYDDVPHYVISIKGNDFIKRYESLKQLFS